MSLQIEDVILNNITTLERLSSKNKRGNRNTLNKWFQDSIKAFFMQKQAGHLLMAAMKKDSIDDVKKVISENLSQEFPIYVSIILRYFELIREYNLEKQFSRNLTEEMYRMQECITDSFVSDYNTEKQIRASFVSYLIYNYFRYYLCNNDISNIYNFFQIWNLSYPEAEVKSRRRNFCQMNQLKKQGVKVLYEEENPSINEFVFPSQTQDITKIEENQNQIMNSNYYFSCKNEYENYYPYNIKIEDDSTKQIPNQQFIIPENQQIPFQEECQNQQQNYFLNQFQPSISLFDENEYLQEENGSSYMESQLNYQNNQYYS